MKYQSETHYYDDGGFVTSGRIVTVLSHSPSAQRLTVLVEKEDAGNFEVVQDSSERVSLKEVSGKIEAGPVTDATCAGIDGECSRTVENEGDRCWQHEDDE